MSWVNDKRKDATDFILDSVSNVWEATKSLHDFVIQVNLDFIKDGLKVVFSDVLAPLLKPIFDLLGIEDETIYSIEVVTVPLLDQEASYFKNSIMSSIRNGISIPSALRTLSLTSQRAALNSYTSYGEHHFIDGMPEATISEFFVDREAVTDVLEGIVGQPITISAIDFIKPDSNLWTHYYLVNTFGGTLPVTELTYAGRLYDYDTAVLNSASTYYDVEISRTVSRTAQINNHIIIDSSSGTEHTITYSVINYVHTWPEPGTPLLLTESPQLAYTDNITSSGAPDSHTILPGTISPASDVLYSTTAPDIAPIPLPGAYYHAVYIIDSVPTNTYIWYYHTSDNTYPELNNPAGGTVDALSMTPIVTLREEFVNIDVDPQSPRAVSSQALLDRLNMGDLSSFTASLVDEDNPNDISNIQDAFLLFGVNVYTEDQNSRRYLFNYFMGLSVLPKFDKASFEALPEMDKSTSNLIFKVSEGRYNTTITLNYIEYLELDGVIGTGEVGHTEIEVVINPFTYADVEDLDARYDPNTQLPTDSLGLVNNVYIMRTQLTDTVYAQIEVNGLMLNTFILTVGDRVKLKSVHLVDIITGSDADKANFIIPLSYSILAAQSISETEQVIYNALHMVIYAEEVTDLEYYETQGFLSLVSGVIEFVGVVVTAVTLGAATSVLNFLILLGKALLVTTALQFVLKEALSHNLSDAEKALLLALYIYGSRRGAGITSPILSIDSLLLSISAVANFIQTDTSFKIGELIEQQQEFVSLVNEREEELKLAKDNLNLGNSIDTFSLLSNQTVAILDTDTSPEEFYTRSTLTNLAPIVYEHTDTFVTNALDINLLPTQFNTNSDLLS